MIVNKVENKDILDLFQVELIEGNIKVRLKNGSTLLITPVVVEGVVTDYNMEYLTGKENKNISKLESKIAELMGKISDIKQNGGDETTDGDETSDDISDEAVQGDDQDKDKVVVE